MLAGGVSVTGCGVRLESEAPTWPSPDAVTVERDSLAMAVAGVKEAASRETGASASLAATVSASQLDALGGVYVAFPSQEPGSGSSGADAPATDVALAAPQTLSDAIASLRAAAVETEQTSSDPALISLARSIDVAWAQFVWLSSHGADPAAAPRESLPFPLVGADARPADDSEAELAFAPAGSSEMQAQTLSDLALAHDKARYAYEVVAAHAAGDERAAALNRAREHAARAEAFAGLLADDERTPLYQLRAADLMTEQGRLTVTAAVERDIASLLEPLTAQATAADIEWVLNDYFDTWTCAIDLASRAGASPDSFDPLPGIDTAG